LGKLFDGGDGRFRHGIGNNFDGAHHFALGNGRVVGQGGQGDAQLAVQLVQPGGIDAQHAQGIGLEVNAPGGGAAGVEVRPHHRVGDAAGGAVLVHIARFELGHVDHAAAGAAQGGQVVWGDGVALTEEATAVWPGDVVAQDFARGVVNGNRSKFHKVRTLV
jgi:hypothetical protein